jgi:hypothetical protein
VHSSVSSQAPSSDASVQVRPASSQPVIVHVAPSASGQGFAPCSQLPAGHVSGAQNRPKPAHSSSASQASGGEQPVGAVRAVGRVKTLAGVARVVGALDVVAASTAPLVAHAVVADRAHAGVRGRRAVLTDRAVAVGVPVDVRVDVGVHVAVDVGVHVRVGVGVGVGVHVRVGVGVRVGVSVAAGPNLRSIEVEQEGAAGHGEEGGGQEKESSMHEPIRPRSARLPQPPDRVVSRRVKKMTTASVAALVLSCGGGAPPPSHTPGDARPPAPVAPTGPTFGDDVTFLRQHTELILLSSADRDAQVAVAPEYQGRIMTSTAAGPTGASFGWINRTAIASGQRQPHINVFGGEDRFWLGPEGGQYSLYFAPQVPFDLQHWQVPEPIDWGGWEVLERARDRATFRKDMSLDNRAGTRFDMRAERTVRILERGEVLASLGVALPGTVRVVAIESNNRITNTGTAPWRRESGLPSIWILGMFVPTPGTTIVIPFRRGPEAELGPVVNDAYFGRVPASRLVVGDGVVFFRGDGLARGKIGIPRPRALPVMGSWDSTRQVLTIVQLQIPEGATDYVSSLWQEQTEPYRGDVVNSYNDGPPAPGAPPLGPFYELESSSPAAALAPGETLAHVHRTLHLQGPVDALDAVARALLTVGIDDIAHALP